MQKFEQLEAEFGEYMGYKPEQMVACSSGTAALHLAFEALRKVWVQTVTMPDFSMVACARAASLAGINPEFVDCNDRLLSEQHHTLVGAESSLFVHVYGRRCHMEVMHRALRGRFIVEDMAELHGINPHPHSYAACWSFYKNKIIAGEEGGMVAFREEGVASLARKLRSLGFTDAHDFRHIPRGHNYRLSNVHAELILRSLHYVNENIEDRKVIADTYDELVPSLWKMPPRDANWVYDVRILDMTHEKQRAIVAELNRQGVAARCAFYPLSLQDEYRIENQPKLTNAFRLSAEVMYLPVSPLMTPDDVAKNVAALKRAVLG